MNRFLIGILLGVLLGLTVGYVAFSRKSSVELAPTLAPVLGAAPGRELAARTPGSRSADLEADVSRSASRELAPVATGVSPLTKVRVAEVLSNAPSAKPRVEQGQLEITGQVLDDQGNGVPGVLVRARRRRTSMQMVRSGDYAQGAPEDSLEKDLLKAAERYEKRLSGTHQTTTDAGGSYRIENLADAEYSMTAYKVDFDVKRTVPGSYIAAPGACDFSARAVLPVSVQVLLPSGELAEDALILCENLDSVQRRLGPFEWSARNPELRLPVGSLRLTAVRGIVGNGSWVRAESAAFASSEVDVRLGGGASPGTISLELQAKLGIRGRATADGDASVSNLLVRMLPLGKSRQYTEEQLGESEQMAWLSAGAEYSFLGLEPGFYAIGLGRSWNSRCEAHQLVEVTDSIVEVDLVLPELKVEQALTVHVTGADGSPQSGVQFSFSYEESSSSYSTGMQPVRVRGGTYTLELPSDAHAEYFQEDVTSMKFFLRVEHKAYGVKSIGLEPGQLECSVQFAEPAELEVTLPGYANSLIAGRGSLDLARLGEDGEPAEGGWSRNRTNVGPDGVLNLGKLDPGSYRLTLSVKEEGADRWSRTTIHHQDLELRSGPNNVRVSIPDLYSFTIEVLDSEDATLTLRRVNQEGSTAASYHSRKSCEGECRITYPDLLAGEYILSVRANGKSKRETLTVPTGDLTWDPADW